MQQKLCFRMPTVNPESLISTGTVSTTTTTSPLYTAASVNSVSSVTLVTPAITTPAQSQSAIASCPEVPYHPPRNFKFPQTIQSKAWRSCHAEWFETWNWLHYVQESDCVYCYVFAETRGLLSKTCKQDAAFVTTGFRCWKHASDKFNEHERSETHKLCAEKVCNGFYVSNQTIINNKYVVNWNLALKTLEIEFLTTLSGLNSKNTPAIGMFCIVLML